MLTPSQSTIVSILLWYTDFTFFNQRRLLVWWLPCKWAKLTTLSVGKLVLRRGSCSGTMWPTKLVDHSVCKRKLQNSCYGSAGPSRQTHPCHLEGSMGMCIIKVCIKKWEEYIAEGSAGTKCKLMHRRACSSQVWLLLYAALRHAARDSIYKLIRGDPHTPAKFHGGSLH